MVNDKQSRGPHSRCMPRFGLLDSGQIEQLHSATIAILETVGVKVMHDGAQRLLADAGCRIHKDNIVRIPGSLVEQSIQSAPSRLTVYDRQGKAALKLWDRRVYFGLGTDLLNTLDPDTGELRPTCLKDVIDAAVVADCCEHIDFVAPFGFPGDVAQNIAGISAFKAVVENSTKPIYFTAAGPKELAVIIEMAAVVAGGEKALAQKPFLIQYAEPLSPLVHSREAVEKLMMCADKGIPLNYVPALMSGATGPVTLAGAIAVANAEALSGLVIHQLKREGAPMISGFSVTPLDMVNGTTVYGSPDERLTHAACAELYRHYDLPVWGEAGCSDAKSLDGQAAIESAVSVMTAALDGTNLVHNVGYLGQGLIGSPAAIVMGNEIISYVKRIMAGFVVDKEHLALDLIGRIGPGGNYLTENHTLEHFRQEHWRPHCINRQNPETWQESGCPCYEQVVAQKAKEILRSHTPQPLPADVLIAINRIFSRLI